MAIAAIAAAARLFGRDDWLQLARDAYADVLRFRDGDRLPHAILGEKAAYPGLSSDHAGWRWRRLALHQATGGADTPADALGFCGALDRGTATARPGISSPPRTAATFRSGSAAMSTKPSRRRPAR